MKTEAKKVNKPGRRQFLSGICAAGTLGVLPTQMKNSAPPGLRVPEGETVAVVLGSAQDAGLPHVGCTKSHCQSARKNPDLRRRGPCLAVLDGAEKSAFIFDASPDFADQLADIPAEFQKKRKPLEGIFLTHAHIGHYTGLMYLGRAAMNADRVPVYCSKQMADFLRNNGPWSLLVELGNIEIRILEPGRDYPINKNINVKAISVPHRAEFTDTLAFIIRGPRKRILYLPDIDRWEQMKPGISDVLKEVDIALIDGTFYSPEELAGRDMTKIPHPPVVTSMALLQPLADINRKKIFFTHLNHSNLLLDIDGKKLNNLRERGFNITEEMMEFPI